MEKRNEEMKMSPLAVYKLKVKASSRYVYAESNVDGESVLRFRA